MSDRPRPMSSADLKKRFKEVKSSGFLKTLTMKRPVHKVSAGDMMTPKELAEFATSPRSTTSSPGVSQPTSPHLDASDDDPPLILAEIPADIRASLDKKIQVFLGAGAPAKTRGERRKKLHKRSLSQGEYTTDEEKSQSGRTTFIEEKTDPPKSAKMDLTREKTAPQTSTTLPIYESPKETDAAKDSEEIAPTWDDLASPMKFLLQKVSHGLYVIKRTYKSLHKICTLMLSSGEELEKLTTRERSEKYNRIKEDSFEGLVRPALYITQSLDQFAHAEIYFSRKCLLNVVGPLQLYHRQAEEQFKKAELRFNKLKHSLSTLLITVDKKREECLTLWSDLKDNKYKKLDKHLEKMKKSFQELELMIDETDVSMPMEMARDEYKKLRQILEKLERERMKVLASSLHEYHSIYAEFVDPLPGQALFLEAMLKDVDVDRFMHQYAIREKEVFGLCSDPENVHAIHAHRLTSGLPVSYNAISNWEPESDEVKTLIGGKTADRTSIDLADTLPLNTRARHGSLFTLIEKNNVDESKLAEQSKQLKCFKIVRQFREDELPADSPKVQYGAFMCEELVYQVQNPPSVTLPVLETPDREYRDETKMHWKYVARCGMPPGEPAWMPSFCLQEQVVDQYINFGHFMMLPLGVQVFTEHLADEKGDENMLFLGEASEFRKKKYSSADAMKVHFKEICDKYIRTSAPLQINISGPTRSKTLKCEEDAGELDHNVFDRAMREVFSMLQKDSFNRFRKSPRFRRFLQLCGPDYEENSGEPSGSGSGPSLLGLTSSTTKSTFTLDML